MSQIKMENFAIQANQRDPRIDTVCELLNLILEMTMSSLSYDKIYRLVYEIIISRKAADLHQAVHDLLKNYMETVILQKVLSGINSENVSVLLEAWTEHLTCLKYFCSILEHLENPTMVDFHLIGINEIGISTFEKHIISDQTISLTLRDYLIQELHLKHVQSHTDIQRCIDLLIATNQYHTIFEEEYLRAVESFHKKNVEELLKRGSITEYLTAYEEALNRNNEISKTYLRYTTDKSVQKILEDIYIRLHLDEIVRFPIGLSYLLNEFKEAKIVNDIYKLYSRFSDSKILIDFVEEIFFEKGNSFMEKCPQIDKFNAIEKLVELRSRFLYFLKESFENNKDIERKIRVSTQRILNSKEDSPEHLADFFHRILKKKHKMLDAEYDEKISAAIELFVLLRDKESFEKFYRYYLSVRILTYTSPIDAEEENLNKFKTECGLSYTSTMDTMLKDTKISESHLGLFHGHISKDEYQPPNFDFSILVLNSACWKLTGCPPCSLPPGPSSMFELYSQFYIEKHSKAKLILQPNTGTATLKGYFTKSNGNSVTYDFDMSTYQMTILMLFNEHKCLNVKEIEDKTGIPMKELQTALYAMTSGKSPCGILLSNEDENPPVEEKMYKINEQFKGKSRKIKVPPAKVHKRTKEDDIKSIWAEANRNRKDITQAAIVRVMKARKEMLENDLIADVVEILQQHFLPEIQNVKSLIRYLIEKEYIEVDASNHKMYRYLA